jgi:hypothetical protein
VPGDDPIHVGVLVVSDPAGTLYLWHEGCAGVPETKGFLDFSTVEQNQPEWVAANNDWVARAKKGVGVEGGPDPDVKTATSYFYRPGYTPYGKSWGAPFRPDLDCGALPSPTPQLCVSPIPTTDPLGTPLLVCPSPSPSLSPSPSPSATPGETITPEPTVSHGPPTPTPTQEPTPTPEVTPTPTPSPTPTESPT